MLKEYMADEKQIDTEDVKVSICCITYNHVEYIEKALIGFLIQKTKFKYEILIHDDASTDGTTEILKEYKKRYPDKIRLFLEEENQYSRGAKRMVSFLFPHIRGKYVALCEGDDEWIYYGKLQEQLDWMETHPNTSLCVHNAIRYQKDEDELALQVSGQRTGYLTDDEIILKKCGEIPTASFFFRAKYIEELPECYFEAPGGDDSLKVCLACRGEVYYMNCAWSLRNYLHPGSWTRTFKENSKYVKYYHITQVKFLIDFSEYAGKRFKKEIGEDIKQHLGGYYFAERTGWEHTRDLLKSIANFKEEVGHKCDRLCDEWFYEFCWLCPDYKEWLLMDCFPGIKQNKENLYIYGAGVEAKKHARILNERDISYDGFIVSDSNRASEELLGHKVYVLKDIDISDKINIWLGMNEENKKQVLPVLKKLDFLKIYM